MVDIENLKAFASHASFLRKFLEGMFFQNEGRNHKRKDIHTGNKRPNTEERQTLTKMVNRPHGGSATPVADNQLR